MGGQTALKLAIEAENLGIWEKYNCRRVGVDAVPIGVFVPLSPAKTYKVVPTPQQQVQNQQKLKKSRYHLFSPAI